MLQKKNGVEDKLVHKKQINQKNLLNNYIFNYVYNQTDTLLLVEIQFLCTAGTYKRLIVNENSDLFLNYQLYSYTIN